jgi:aminoglycoside 3-N-acetyltransferase
MSERETIEQVDDPVTVSSLSTDIREMGVRAGDTVLVHSSLTSLGWVCGGAQTVVDALREVLTDSGTLVMPTHTSQYSDPADWSNPPVPDEWVEQIRETTSPFRPSVTPTRGMGAIPECFRNYPDVVRSDHPEYSFAAWGADAETIVADHGFDDSLGEHSPIARVYEQDGDILLLGVGHDSNTSLHLAEYRADIRKERVQHGAPVMKDDRRVRIGYEDIEINSDDFTDLGADFERQVNITEGTVGAADTKLVNQRAIVDFAVDWFEANR